MSMFLNKYDQNQFQIRNVVIKIEIVSLSDNKRKNIKAFSKYSKSKLSRKAATKAVTKRSQKLSKENLLNYLLNKILVLSDQWNGNTRAETRINCQIIFMSIKIKQYAWKHDKTKEKKYKNSDTKKQKRKK